MEKNNIKKQDYFSKTPKTKILFFLSTSFALVFMIAFASITYAWVFSTEFSDITGVDIEIGKSQGLVMTIDGNVSESININTYLGTSFATFALKEASSHNGRDLYLRDSGMYYVDEENIYDGFDIARDGVGIIQFRDAQEADRNVNFLYFSLLLEATGENRYLIFDAVSSYIKDVNNDPIDPVRVSLTFIEDEEVLGTKIIGNRQEYFGNYYTDAVSHIDGDTKVGHNTTQDVETFNGYTGYDGSVFDPTKTLYYLQENEPVNVIVRIWLEGGDPMCTNSIAGSFLNIELHFDNIAESEVI